MAAVKVYLPTFRRHKLLPRALGSLRDQTFKDWICEVHNDDPEDSFPAQLVASAGDPRIQTVNHRKRLGGAATMNAFYAPVVENFVSILEDDNWWEPQFLAEMVAAAERNPHATVFWANMKLWQEREDGSFADTGKTTYSVEGPAYEEFPWPHRRQVLGAIHSNGACLIRARPGGDYRIPEVPFSVIEMFRERIFPQPLVLVRKPLANFSMTLATERARDGAAWAEATAALAATFINKAGWNDKEARVALDSGRRKSPPSTNAFLNAALVDRSCRMFFRLATTREIVRWVAGLVRRPRVLLSLLFSKRSHAEWWSFLREHTGQRFAEARFR